MKNVQIVLEDSEYERYVRLSEKGATHKKLYMSGLTEEEKKDEQVVLNLQAENFK